MKKSKITIGIAAIVVVIALVICVLLFGKDKTGPVIAVPSDIQYKSGMTDKELLEGVTAVDSRDGDVSDTLIVKSVIELSKGNNVKITYAAQDSHNNITEKSITLSYEGGNNAENPTEDENVPDEPATDDTSSPDVTQEIPDESSSEEPTPVETVSPEAPVLTLTTYTTEIVKGSEVNWLQFVSDITDDKDSRSELFTRIMINDYADINTPGEYNMKYTCSDSDGNVSPVAVLTVKIVE